jgi:hypothetical protein
MFFLGRKEPGCYTVLVALGGPCHLHYYGQLTGKEECTIPPTMTMVPGENILVEYTSGHAAVFDQYAIHAGGTYTKDQCNIDFSPILKDPTITIACSVCSHINSQDTTICAMCGVSFLTEMCGQSSLERKKEVIRYNVRLHLEVDTSNPQKRRSNGTGFDVSSCKFMNKLIKEFETRAKERDLFIETRAKERDLFISNLGKNDVVLEYKNLTLLNKDAKRVSRGWFSDKLIDFRIQSSVDVVGNNNVKYLSPLFFAKLKEAPPLTQTVKGIEKKIAQSLPGSHIDFEKVYSWIRKDMGWAGKCSKEDTNLLKKELILFPINQNNLHWYLVSFIQPKLLFEFSTYSEQQQPFVIVLDSMVKNKKLYKNVVQALKEFLYQCWQKDMMEKKIEVTSENADELRKKLEELPTVFPDCPQQPNSVDCGVHVVKHAKNIARTFQHLKLKKNNRGNLVLDFNLCKDLTPDVTAERKNFMDQLEKLIEDYQLVKKKEVVINVDSDDE